MLRRSMSGAVPFPEDRADRRDVKSAWDKDYDPSYGSEPEGQVILDQPTTSSFANLRDEMNERRRQTARRMNC